MNVQQRGDATGLGASAVYVIDRFEIDVQIHQELVHHKMTVTDLTQVSLMF